MKPASESSVFRAVIVSFLVVRECRDDAQTDGRGNNGQIASQAGHPIHQKRTVVPKRLPNAELRTREHLTEAELDKLMTAAKGNRCGHRDSTMILVGYRHGMRAWELTDQHWDQIDFTTGTMHSAG
jgi:integrase